MCKSYVNHLELVFINVLVLQSFLDVSTVSTIPITARTNVLVHLNYNPEFELIADLYMTEAVTVIPWDLREAYYCLNIQ